MRGQIREHRRTRIEDTVREPERVEHQEGGYSRDDNGHYTVVDNIGSRMDVRGDLALAICAGQSVPVEPL